MLALLGFELARPEASWALLSVPVLLLLVRALARPPEEVTGTLFLWRDLEESRTGALRRARLPVWALVTALALLSGALAWMGPRSVQARAPENWTVLVDRSPSMGLPVLPGGPSSRLDVALAAAREAFARTLGAADRVRWTSPSRAPLELAPGELPPPEWLEPRADEEPDWGSHDRPGTLWVTDRVPAVAREHAGLCASGGAEVPGVVALDGGDDVLWEGGTLVRRPRARLPAVGIEEPPDARLPAVVERVLTAWCEARGLELVRRAPDDGLFTLALAPGAVAEAELGFGRDGWWATGRATSFAAADGAGSEDWLAADVGAAAPQVLVRARAGRIELALHTFTAPQGDPAAFALSWSQLFERCSELPADVVPLAERLTAGEPVRDLGARPAAQSSADTGLGPMLDAALALLAALGGLCAWRLGVRG